MNMDTRYNLEIYWTDGSNTEIEPCLSKDIARELSRINPNYFSDLEQIKEFNDYDSMKWYHHEQDMRKLSKEFPSLIFCLRGEGEEAGDLWEKYFCRGEVSVRQAMIIFLEPDEEFARQCIKDYNIPSTYVI